MFFRLACLAVAIVLFVLLAFTVFHGQAVTRAEFLGFAFFAGAFLPWPGVGDITR